MTNMPASLDENQLRYFDAFGFIVLKGLLTPREVFELQSEWTTCVEESARLVPITDDTSRAVSALVPSAPFTTRLYEDDRFAGLAEQLFGEVICANAIHHRYVGDSVWHYDAGGYEAYGLKFAIYLDPVRADSGALRIIPGSHLRTYHDKVTACDPIGPRFSRNAVTPGDRQRALDELGSVPCVVCDSDPGDVVAFDLRTYHASKGGGVGRRMCSFTYYHYPREPAEIELIIHNARTHMAGLPQQWAADAERHPRRAAWIDALRRFSDMDLEQRGVRAVVENGKWYIEEIA